MLRMPACGGAECRACVCVGGGVGSAQTTGRQAALKLRARRTCTARQCRLWNVMRQGPELVWRASHQVRPGTVSKQRPQVWAPAAGICVECKPTGTTAEGGQQLR